MRPKVVMTVLTAALLVFGSLFAIRYSAGHSIKRAETQPTISSAPQTSEMPMPVAKPVEQAAAPRANPGQSDTHTGPSSEDTHKAYVEQRSSQLMELAMNDDRASLDTILSELGNRDPEIRKAALDAAIQFGSRDAIPKLADAASQTDDPNEKTALADAIEFLKLPSLTEIRQQSSKSVVNAAAPGSAPRRKGGFGKRDLPAPAPQSNQ